MKQFIRQQSQRTEIGIGLGPVVTPYGSLTLRLSVLRAGFVELTQVVSLVGFNFRPHAAKPKIEMSSPERRKYFPQLLSWQTLTSVLRIAYCCESRVFGSRIRARSVVEAKSYSRCGELDGRAYSRTLSV